MWSWPGRLLRRALREKQLRALANRVEVVADQYLAVFKDFYQSILVLELRACDVFDRVEFSRLRLNQRQPSVLRILSRISDWIFEYRPPFSIDLRGGTLEGKSLGIPIQLLQ